MAEKPKFTVAAVTRTTQIIVAALAQGVLIFGIIAWFIHPIAEDVSGNVFLIVGFIFAGGCIVGRIAVPALITSTFVSRLARAKSAETDVNDATKPPSDVVSLAGLYQTTLIIGAAMLEGAAFCNLICFMLEGNLLNLGLAGILAAGILMMFPTKTRVENWIKAQQRQIDEERMMKPMQR